MTKYLRDKKTHKAINNQYFKRLNIVAKELYEVEFLKSTIEHRELFIVGFFILQYAKLRMLELCYNFFDKFCDVNNFEELEKDNGYRFPLFGLGRRRFRCLHPLAEEDLETANEARTVETTSEQMQKKKQFFFRACCSKHKTHDKREPGLFKKEFRCTEKLCLCSKTCCCYDSKSQKYKLSSKGLF